MSSLAVLKGFSAARLASIVNQLNDTGFVNDEDDLELGTSLVEHWSEACTDWLRVHGYTGGELHVIAKYFSDKGEIYVLYDADRHEDADAQKELERVGHLP